MAKWGSSATNRNVGHILPDAVSIEIRIGITVLGRAAEGRKSFSDACLLVAMVATYH
jgi:hypothetical protein